LSNRLALLPGNYGNQIFPQQEPGPAHPGAWPGLEPQQAVSEEPGMPLGFCPVRLDVADINFVRSLLPQLGHSGCEVVEKISSSLAWPHFSHLYS